MMPDACSTFAGASVKTIYSPSATAVLTNTQTDRGTRTAVRARSADRRREGRHPGVAELAHGRVLARALAARADYARRAAQMRASHRRQRDPVGGREPPAPPVGGRVCGQCAVAA